MFKGLETPKERGLALIVIALGIACGTAHFTQDFVLIFLHVFQFFSENVADLEPFREPYVKHAFTFGYLATYGITFGAAFATMLWALNMSWSAGRLAFSFIALLASGVGVFFILMQYLPTMVMFPLATIALFAISIMASGARMRV